MIRILHTTHGRVDFWRTITAVYSDRLAKFQPSWLQHFLNQVDKIILNNGTRLVVEPRRSSAHFAVREMLRVVIHFYGHYVSAIPIAVAAAVMIEISIWKMYFQIVLLTFIFRY